jgi:DNA-binding transcriptional regulator YdaS (Cro superfamily)
MVADRACRNADPPSEFLLAQLEVVASGLDPLSYGVHRCDWASQLRHDGECVILTNVSNEVVVKTPLDRAIERAGGPASLARLLRVSSNLPNMWKVRGKVPADYCPAIERETGVSCEELRPDVAWGVLRGSPEVIASGPATSVR